MKFIPFTLSARGIWDLGGKAQKAARRVIPGQGFTHRVAVRGGGQQLRLPPGVVPRIPVKLW